MNYLKDYDRPHFTKTSKARITARMLIVLFVAMALLTALPMDAPIVQGARVVNTFEDGETTAVVEFQNDPLPGERATVYLKVKADSTVAQARMTASAVLLEVGSAFRIVAAPAHVLANRGIDTSGDVNGDGLTDLIITAPGSNSYLGLLAGFFGRTTGYTTAAQEIGILGDNSNDCMGWSLHTGGDIDGDGFDDIVSSRIKMDFGTNTGTGTGDTVIWWGARTITGAPDLTLSVGSSGDMFGYSVWADGDINGDGNTDLVVGAPRHVENTNNPGRAYVYLLNGTRSIRNTPNITLTGSDNGDIFGGVVNICGDVNGDGYDDVLVTASGHNGTGTDFDVGKVYVYYGSSSGVSTTADWTYTGKTKEDRLGWSASGIGDVNDDGYDDILIGVPLYDTSSKTDAGAALVFYGGSGGLSSSPDVTIEGDTANGLLAYDLAHSEDINGDDIDDFVIGVPNTSNGTLSSNGHIQVHFGDSNGVSSTPDKRLGGWYDDGDMGSSVGPSGDGTGDGYSEICAGDIFGLRTYVFYGGADASTPKVYLDNTLIWSNAGALRGDEEIPDFTEELNAYIQAHLSEQDGTGHLRVPINVSLGRAGKLKLGGIFIQVYKLEVPTGLQARPLAEGNAVRLSWDDHTAKSDDISKMAIEFWNGTGWEELMKVPRLNTSHVIRGLTDGIEYRFRLRAFDGDVSVYSQASAEVRATPTDTKPPERVMDVVTAEDREVMGINLSWGASDPDTANYEVWSNKTGEWAVLVNVSAPETNYIDTDVEDGPRYYYRVRAWDEVPLDGPLSAIVYGRLRDLEPPARPTNVTVTPVVTGNALRISWDLNDDDTVKYSVTSNKSGPWLEVGSVPAALSSFVDTGLKDGTTYFYRVRAFDESENPSEASELTSGIPVDSTPPMVPVDVAVEVRPQGETLRITWTVNTDDTTIYAIYVWNASSSRFEARGQTSSNVGMYELSGLMDGVDYRIKVSAKDEVGLESTLSEEVTGKPKDTLFPKIPTGLSIDLDPRGGRVNISWIPNEDDTVEYIVLRWDVDANDYLPQGTVPADVTWFEDTGLENNRPYAYVVVAVDEAGNKSPFSQREEAIPVDTVPPEVPGFTDLPTMINYRDVTITGICEPGVTITLYVNLLEQPETECDDQGRFSVDVHLKAGPNDIYAKATDTSGIPTESPKVIVRVDLLGPKVETTSPVAGTKGVDRVNFTFQVWFSEEVGKDTIKVLMRKGRHTDLLELLLMILEPDNIEPELVEYDRARSLATFEVKEELAGGSVYTILIYDVEDVAGNPMDHEWNAYTFTIETRGSGGGGDGDGDDGDDGGGMGIYIGAGVIIIVLVIVVVLFFVMRSGTTEEIEVDRSVIEAAPQEPPTPEEQRPDMDSLYASAYDERGEADTERHDVEGGLGEWLAEQEAAQAEAAMETELMLKEIAEAEPPAEEEGPIDEIPPGMLPEDEHVATAEVETLEEETEGPAEAEDEGPIDDEADEEPDEEPDEPADEEAEEEAGEKVGEELDELIDDLDEEEAEPEEEPKEE